MTEDGTPSRATRVRRVVSILAAVVLALLVAEGALRFYYFAPTVEDPVEGSVPLAGATSRVCIEGCGTAHNQLGGLRRATPFDPEAPAILSIGDSFTAAAQVDDTETFTSLLERDLHGAGLGPPFEPREGHPLEVLNVGRSAYSVADYVAFAPTFLERWKPLWTVVELNETDFGAEAWSASTASPHFVVGEDGEPSLVDIPRATSRRTRMLGPLLRRSALLQFVLFRWNQLTQVSEPPLFGAGAKKPAETAKPWDVDGRTHALTTSLAGAFDRRITLLYLPLGRVDGTLEARERIEREFDEACVDLALSCVNMRETFTEMLARHEAPFGFANTSMNVGHLNARGHAAVARALLAELSKTLGR